MGFSKHLLTWGLEKTALEKVVECDSCMFQDVQHEFFKSGGKGKSVAECIHSTPEELSFFGKGSAV